LAQWFENLSTRASLALTNTVRATGVFDKHIAGWRFAQIEIAVEPAEQLSVEVELPEEQRFAMERDGYLEEAVFGILDVLMTGETAPLRNVQIRIVGAKIHPVDSSRMAFRLAGRDAAKKVLAATKRSAAVPLAGESPENSNHFGQ
jgi:hypothetical protein